MQKISQWLLNIHVLHHAHTKSAMVLTNWQNRILTHGKIYRLDDSFYGAISRWLSFIYQHCFCRNIAICIKLIHLVRFMLFENEWRTYCQSYMSLIYEPFKLWLIVFSGSSTVQGYTVYSIVPGQDVVQLVQSMMAAKNRTVLGEHLVVTNLVEGTNLSKG